MLLDRVWNLVSLALESGVPPTVLCGPAYIQTLKASFDQI